MAMPSVSAITVGVTMRRAETLAGEKMDTAAPDELVASRCSAPPVSSS
jgi:hypothetical protein